MKRFLLAAALVLTAQLAHATCDGTTTANRGLCKPNHGAYTNNWETVLNPNYALLDFTCTAPLACAGTTIAITGTVGHAHGGTDQTSYAKGDSLWGLAAGGLGILSVGPNGATLIADSAQTPGVKWGTVVPSLPVVDTNSLVKGSSDATKKVRIEADGLPTTTTRVMDAPEADGQLAIKSGSFTDTHCVKYDDATKSFKDAGAACGTGSGSGKQVFTSSTGAATVNDNSGNPMYMPISGEGLSTSGDTHDMLMQVAGTAKKLCCLAGATGDGYAFTVRDSYLGDTTVTCDTGVSGGYCCTTTEDDDVGDIGAQETMVIKILSTGTGSASPAQCQWTLEFR